MNVSRLAIITLVVGMILFAVSFVDPKWSGSPQRQWTAEDAQEYQELSRSMHSLDYQFAAERKKNPRARPSDEFARVSDSFLQKEQKLVGAQQAGQGTAQLLYYLGIGLVTLGGIGYLVCQSSDD